MALHGKTILITRSASQSDDLRIGLEARGARVIECPMTVITPVEDWTEVDRAIDNLLSYQWILFTSTNAVEFFMRRVSQKNASFTAAVAAIGSSTARQLEAWQIKAIVPATFRAEGLLEMFPSDLHGVRILFPRAEVARELVPEELRRRGAVVDVIPVYRTVKAQAQEDDVALIFMVEKVDAIAFTSPSAVRFFTETVPISQVQTVPVAVIGPVAREEAEACGLAVKIQPERATIPDLIEAIGKYFD
jgi:uroporphyrinogen III methyltransferase/synthase